MSRFDVRAQAGVCFPCQVMDRPSPIFEAFVEYLLQDIWCRCGIPSGPTWWIRADAFDVDAPAWRLAVEMDLAMPDAERFLRGAGGDLRLAREMARVQGGGL